MTLVKAFPSFTRYLLHRAVAILPSRENCLWDKWDNTPKALKTGSGLFVGATKWVSKTVNKKDMLLPLACWEARIHQHLQSSGSLPYKVSLSFILLQSRLCSGLCSGLSLLCALPPPPIWIVGLSTWYPAGHQSPFFSFKLFPWLCFQRQLIFIIKVDYVRKGAWVNIRILSGS